MSNKITTQYKSGYDHRFNDTDFNHEEYMNIVNYIEKKKELDFLTSNINILTKLNFITNNKIIKNKLIDKNLIDDWEFDE